MFGLSAQQYANEPADKLCTNLYIFGQIQEKQRIEAKHAESS